MNKYLELDQKEGRFYEFSKEAKDGFDKHEPEGGKLSFRKIYKKGAVGVLKFINEKEDDFGKGKVLSAQLVIDDKDGDRLYLKIPVLNSKGSLNDYFEQLATYLPNLKVGEAYRFFPYSIEGEYTNAAGEKKPSTNKGISISTYDLENDEKLIKIERAHTFGKDGDIPDTVWTEEKKLGEIKKVKNDTERMNFLYEVFKGTVSKQSSGEEKPKTEQTPEKPKTNAPSNSAPEIDEEEHDDLPF